MSHGPFALAGTFPPAPVCWAIVNVPPITAISIANTTTSLVLVFIIAPLRCRFHGRRLPRRQTSPNPLPQLQQGMQAFSHRLRAVSAYRHTFPSDDASEK